MSYYDDVSNRYLAHAISEFERAGFRGQESAREKRFYHGEITQDNFWTFRIYSIPKNEAVPDGFYEIDTRPEALGHQGTTYFEGLVSSWMNPKNWRLMKKIYNENNTTFEKSWW